MSITRDGEVFLEDDELDARRHEAQLTAATRDPMRRSILRGDQRPVQVRRASSSRSVRGRVSRRLAAGRRREQGTRTWRARTRTRRGAPGEPRAEETRSHGDGLGEQGGRKGRARPDDERHAARGRGARAAHHLHGGHPADHQAVLGPRARPIPTRSRRRPRRGRGRSSSRSTSPARSRSTATSSTRAT